MGEDEREISPVPLQSSTAVSMNPCQLHNCAPMTVAHGKLPRLIRNAPYNIHGSFKRLGNIDPCREKAADRFLLWEQLSLA